MKIGIIQTAIALICGMVAMKLIDHVSSLQIPQTVSFQIKEGDKNIPIMNLSPDGLLSIDIPRWAKLAEQNKVEADKAAKAQKK